MSDLVTALIDVYGCLDTGQLSRYRSCLAAFGGLYGPGPAQIYHAPGRVNLIGEHTDYNQGFVLPMALDRDIIMLVRPRQDRQVHIYNIESDLYSERSFELASDIPLREVGNWANYVQGAAQYLFRRYPDIRGFDALVDGRSPYGVPRGAGLSSSSALTVASMAAFVGTNCLDLQGQDLALACSEAEWYVGTRGGIMDHFASVLCKQGQALFLDCRVDGNGEYPIRHVPLPADMAVLVADSGIRHNNTGPYFNRRVAECRIGVQLMCRAGLDVLALRDIDADAWDSVEYKLPDEVSRDVLLAEGIDPDALLADGVSAEADSFFVRKRCRHVVTENARVLDAVDALDKGDMPRFGSLLKAAHASARDDYEISLDEIEALVDAAMACKGVLGARLTGAGWGGCIVALVQGQTAENAAECIASFYLAATGKATDIFVCRSARGAGLVLDTLI